MVASIASEYFAKQFREFAIEAAAAEHHRDEQPQSQSQSQSQSGAAQSSVAALSALPGAQSMKIESESKDADHEKTIAVAIGDEASRTSSCCVDYAAHSCLVLLQEIGGDLTLPAGKPLGLVVFAHGPGSGLLSSQNRFLAEELRKQGTATLLVDLMNKSEEDKVVGKVGRI